MLPALDSLQAAIYEPLASIYVEVACIFFFTLGFACLRTDVFGKANRKAIVSKSRASASVTPFDPKLKKTIEVEAAAGHPHAVLEAWRVGQALAPTPKDILKTIVQSFLAAEPHSLSQEILDHMRVHWKDVRNSYVAITLLDTVARSGKFSILLQLWDGLVVRLGMRRSLCMYETMLGGLASAAQVKKVREFQGRMQQDSFKLTARGYSLIMKGFLKHGLVDEVLEKLAEMRHAGFSVPSYAVAQFFCIAAEANRSREMLEAVLDRGLPMSQEAYLAMLDDCVKRRNLELVERLEQQAHTAELLDSGLSGGFLKTYVVLGSERAFGLLRDMEERGQAPGEGSCVALMGHCAKSQFVRFAEDIVRSCRERHLIGIPMYSSLMKVYAYAGLYDKACDLYDQILEDGVKPDAMMYGCLMKFAMECGRTKLLNQLTNEVPSLDIQHYMTLIKSAGQDRDVDRAFEVFKQMQESNLDPDIAAFNGVLDVCAKAGDMRRVKELVKELKESRKADIITFNTLIKALCSKGDLEAAEATLLEIEDAGLQPNDISYNSLLNAFVSGGKVRRAWDLISRMEQKGLQPDHYTLSIMLKSLKKVNGPKPKDVARCFELLDRCTIDICVDEILFNSLLETCFRHKFTQRVEDVIAKYERSRMQPSISTYGSIIKAYSTLRKPDKCWQTWNDLVHQRGLEPTHIVYGCMLDALVCNGRIDEAVDLFEKCESASSNLVLCSILLKGFALSYQPKRASKLWRDMRSKGLKLNLVAYNSILDAQARVGITDVVSEVLQEMEREGVQPDGITHSVVVKAYCMKGELDKAMEAIKTLQQCGLQHEAVVYNTMLDACTKHRNHILFEEVLQDMKQCRISPTNFTLAIVVRSYGRQKQLDKALAAMKHMPRDGGFVPNQQVHSSFISACVTNDAPSEAMKVFRNMLASGQELDGKTYEMILSCLTRHDLLHEAVEIVNEVFGLSGQKRRRVSEDISFSCVETLLNKISQNGLMTELGRPMLERFQAQKSPLSCRLIAKTVCGRPNA